MEKRSEEREKHEKNEGYKEKLSVEELGLLLQKVMPKDFESQIDIEYLKNLRAKTYEKYYLKSYFPQKNKEKYGEETPWYDPRILIPSGKQYQVTEQNELFFINQNLIEGQKDSLKFVIKQIGANLISGKSILNVSLPVDIFESRSLLERSAGQFSCAPKYLRPVADADSLTQMKALSAFLNSFNPLTLIMQKPFNPILG